MTNVRLAVILLVSSLPAATLSRADDAKPIKCPREISYIENMPAATIALPRLTALDKEAGCVTEFKPYPGRRSVVLFNTGHIDGQVCCLRIIEKAFTREFRRSKLSINEATASVWGRKISSDSPTEKVLGFTIGVKWQDNYVAGMDMVKGYDDPAEKVRAFEEGLIGSFLETDQNLEIMMTAGHLSELPHQLKEINTFHAYRYVGAEFSDFMVCFDGVMGAQASASD